MMEENDQVRLVVTPQEVEVEEGNHAKIKRLTLKWSIYFWHRIRNERGDVPGWVLVVLMTTGLVTGIWTLAAPRFDSILRNSLDSMNGIR
jgi:hypothetical protein